MAMSSSVDVCHFRSGQIKYHGKVLFRHSHIITSLLNQTFTAADTAASSDKTYTQVRTLAVVVRFAFGASFGAS